MTTEVRIKVLSLDYRIRQQIIDDVNSKYVLAVNDTQGWGKYTIYLTLDMDGVTKESIISAITTDLLEYVDTIDVSSKSYKEIPENIVDNPFMTADKLL